MKRPTTFFLLLLAAMLFAGCATKRYLVVLDNQTGIISVGEPHLEDFHFIFTGINGTTNSIPSEHVRAVVPYQPKAPSK